MAILGNRCAPVLTGESARRFLEAMEKADRLPRRELPENFFSDIENCLRRSKEQAEKDKSATILKSTHSRAETGSWMSISKNVLSGIRQSCCQKITHL